MSAVHLLRRLAHNNAWSSLRLHRACAELSAADYAKERTSFFPSLPQTLNHILIVDWYYVDALERGGKGRSLLADEMPYGTDLAGLAAAQRAVDLRLVAFTEGLTDDASLQVEVHMERSTHIQKDTVANVLLHLFTHQTHHRGQAHAMLAGTPVPPPQLDEFFMQGELSLREAELRELGLPLV
jgi:uncharacterized damage-inducible protein DinB